MTPADWRQRRQRFLEKIAGRAEQLLKESDNPQQEMAWAEGRLFEANLWNGPLPPRQPASWVEQVIVENWAIMDESMPYLLERAVRPDKAETFEGLIVELIPTEGGL